MFEINPEAIGVYISDLIDESPNLCRQGISAANGLN